MSKSGLEPSEGSRRKQGPGQPVAGRGARRLRLPPAREAPPDREALREVRRFHLGSGGAREASRVEGLLPALLDAYRDVHSLRTEYPLLVSPAAGPAAPDQCRPLGEVLEEVAVSAQVGRALHDNLLRLERHVLRRLEGNRSPLAARPLLVEAAQAVHDELALPESQAAALSEEVGQMIEAIPEDAVVLGYGSAVPALLLAHAVRERRRRIGTSWSADLGRLRQGLGALLEVDRVKRPEMRQADALGQTLGGAAGRLIDPAALARRLESRRGGTAAMDEERRRRVEQALAGVESLEREIEALGRGQSPPLLLVAEPELRGALPEDGVAADLCRVEAAEDPCAEIARHFDEAAASLGERLAAVRTARLEIEGAYDRERHDPWLAEFDWQAFSPEELRLLPPMAAVISGDLAAGTGMVSLSRLLLSGRPVQVLVLVDPAGNPGVEGPGAPTGFRFEPGYLAIGHREAFVSQVSSAAPRPMAAVFDRGVASNRTALHVVAAATDPVGGLQAALVAGAAVEGRAHPFFRFDPEAGDSWARRFELGANPEPGMDWPTAELEVEGEEGEEQMRLPFTFADFALLDRRYASCFDPLPDDLASDDLVPLDRWLALEPDEEAHAVPFVWAADGEGLLRRLVVSRGLALACRDRLDYWHTLQELAGLHNEHVLGAEQRVRQEWEGRLEAQRSELEMRHAAELEAVRAKAAEEVVEALTTGLLGDGEALVSLDSLRRETGAATAATPPTPLTDAPAGADAEVPAEPVTAVEAAVDEVVEDEEGVEAWIDTDLCTSCNDCINLNPRMFAYNQDKKAYIKDPRAGTFEDLVRAAEQCPARVIHPGTPLDPSEENLDELVERAAKFA